MFLHWAFISKLNYLYMEYIEEIHKMAIIAIEACAKKYGVKLELSFTGSVWKIKTMGKRFVNRDFQTACKEAVLFVYNAHNTKTDKIEC